MTNDAPVTPDELAAWKAMLARYDEYLKQPYGPQMPAERAAYDYTLAAMPEIARRLVREVERLEAENARLRAQIKEPVTFYDDDGAIWIYNRSPEQDRSAAEPSDRTHEED